MLRSFVGLAAASLAAALAFAPAPASAYTPESGIWWNPNESGTGVVIEVQDNLMVVAAYVGDAQGKATWYTATTFLDGNALFEGSLDLTQGSQCMGCAYPGLPTVTPGAGGDITIVFDPDDETKAALTWDNGRTIPIERFEFYTRRPEDGGSVPTAVTKMLGEWQWVIDYSSLGGNVYPYYGDILVFGSCGTNREICFEYNNQQQRWFYDGCRTDDSVEGYCSQYALNNHDASGYYDPETGLQVIVVNDSADDWALYVAMIGTNDTNSAGAELTVYPKNGNPDNYDAFPARAFRTASRTFVEEGFGPSKRAEASTPTTTRPGMGQMLREAGIDTTKSSGGRKSSYDLVALRPIIRTLEARIESRQQ